MIAGVCQGLSDHFNIPVVLIRLIFIFTTFIGGAGIFIYLWLCLVPANSSKIEKNLKKRKKTPVRNFANMILTICVYIPTMTFLLITFFVALFGLRQKIFNEDIFRFSLSDIGIPGVIMGISLALLCATGIYILSHLLLQLHFGKSIIQKKYPLFLWMLLLSSLFISASVIATECQITVKKTYKQNYIMKSKDFHLPTFTTQIPIRHINLTTHPGEKVKIAYTIMSHNLSREKAENFLDNIEIHANHCTEIYSQEAPSSYFAELEIKIELPKNKNLHVKFLPNASAIKISGEWNKVYIPILAINLEKKAYKSQVSYGRTQINISINQSSEKSKNAKNKKY